MKMKYADYLQKTLNQWILKYFNFLFWSGPHYALEYFLFFPSFLSFIKFFGVFQLMFANIINV